MANLSAEDRMDFPKLVAALENRFGAKHQQQQSRVLLNTMKSRKSEPLQELVENIERRVRLAYPEATGDVQEALTLHHLTTAIDERMQTELLRRKPRRLQDALEVLMTEGPSETATDTSTRLPGGKSAQVRRQLSSSIRPQMRPSMLR